MDKQLFDDAIGEVPPSTVDVDAAIVRGRRAGRLRRVANPAVAAGVAVVLLTGVVAYTLTSGDDGGTPVGGPPGTTSAAPPSSTTQELPDGVSTVEPDDTVPPPQCEGRLEPAAEAAARLTLATTDAVKAQRPDLELSANPEGDYPAGTPHGPLDYHQVNAADPGIELSICDPKATFEATATTTSADGSGNIFVLMEPTWHDGLGPVCATPGLGTRTFCAPETGSRGEEIVKQTAEMGGGITMNQVLVHRQDGTRILVQAENIGTSGKTGHAPTASKPPLTLDQLAAIGVDPALTMFPG